MVVNEEGFQTLLVSKAKKVLENRKEIIVEVKWVFITGAPL